MKMALVVSLFVLGVIAVYFGAAFGPAEFAHAQEPAPAPAVDRTVQEPLALLDCYEMMDLMMDPVYENLKNAVAVEPAGRKEWRAIYVPTYQIGEQANLLFSRKDEDYMLTDDWKKQAVELRESAYALGEAVKARDYAAVKAKYTALIDSCNKCHTVLNLEDAPKVEYVDPPKAEGAAETPPTANE